MVPRVQMNKAPTAVNGIIDDDIQPSTSTATFCDVGYIRRIGAALGISPEELSDQAIQQINSNVSYILRSVICGSLRFAQHSRRTRIMPEDVDAHLGLERKPALYGFKPREMLALRIAGSGGREVFVEDDREVPLGPIYTATAPKIPPNPSIRTHWLAIDGEQPAVPENPVPDRREASSSAADSSIKDDDVQEETNRIMNILRGQKAMENVNVKTTTTHSLSLEQQVYYKEVTEAIMGNDDMRRSEALHSLKTDVGIQPLVGRFSVAVAEGVRCNIVQCNLAFLIYLMRLVHSLVLNPAISLDKWLHEFLPSILSCILSRQVCTRPESDNHWALREFAGRLLAELCKKHQGPDIQSRVIKVLTKSWMESTSSMATLYGSMYTLDHFGLETIRSVVLPMIPGLYGRVDVALNDRVDHGERIAADKLHQYTTKAIITYIRTLRPATLSSYQDYVDLLGGFAERVFSVVSVDVNSVRVASSRGRGGPTMTSRPVAPRGSYGAPQPGRGGGSGSGGGGGRLLTNGGHQVRYVSPNPAARRPSANLPGSSRPPL